MAISRIFRKYKKIAKKFKKVYNLFVDNLFYYPFHGIKHFNFHVWGGKC